MDDDARTDEFDVRFGGCDALDVRYEGVDPLEVVIRVRSWDWGSYPFESQCIHSKQKGDLP